MTATHPHPQQQPNHMPSEEEIRRECEALQAGWTDCERAKRAVGYSPEPLEVTTGSFRKMDGRAEKQEGLF